MFRNLPPSFSHPVASPSAGAVSSLPGKNSRTGRYAEQGHSYRPGGAGYRFSSSARIALRRILPLMVFGSSSTNSMMRGYFWFVGRADDVIKSSGYRIGPFEVESALMTHPAVVECAITGVPDEIRGQVVKATIILGEKYRPRAGEELIRE